MMSSSSGEMSTAGAEMAVTSGPQQQQQQGAVTPAAAVESLLQMERANQSSDPDLFLPSAEDVDVSSSPDAVEVLPDDMRFSSAQVISIVGYSALFLVSSVANLTVLNILLRRYRKNKSRVNLLLINLAIADLLVTFLMMPLEIGWNATVMWTAGDLLCRVFSFFRIFGLFLSGNILICISIDRFYAIVCPLATGKAARNMRILLVSAWVLAAVYASPQIYIFHVESHPDFQWYTQCVTYHSFPTEAWERLYTIFGMVATYVVPLVVIIVTYTIILLTIRRKSGAAGAHRRHNDDGDGLRRSGAGVLNRARARTLKMTVVIVCVFIFCWTPYYTIVLWFLIDKESFSHVDQRVQKLLFIFACTNSVMDPIVYGFFNLRKSGGRTTNRGGLQLQVNRASNNTNNTNTDFNHSDFIRTTNNANGIIKVKAAGNNGSSANLHVVKHLSPSPRRNGCFV